VEIPIAGHQTAGTAYTASANPSVILQNAKTAWTAPVRFVVVQAKNVALTPPMVIVATLTKPAAMVIVVGKVMFVAMMDRVKCHAYNRNKTYALRSGI